ncbi:MAG: hypothetical protein EAZ95_14180 [Bacteroidetes bacterium]|nr:MAG: hypothetical protein EAZ95_14180 [Bacteroidota bacterium]
MELLYEQPFGRITYEPENEMIYLELIGEINKEDYKIIFNATADLGVERKIKRLLVNQATMQKSSMESKAWLVTNWIPRVRKAFNDDMRASIILSNNLFTKIGGEYIASAVRKISGFNLRTFTNPDDARAWVLGD